jgi:hypothetical protein
MQACRIKESWSNKEDPSCASTIARWNYASTTQCIIAVPQLHELKEKKNATYAISNSTIFF